LTEIDRAALWRKSSFSGEGDCLELLVCTNGVRLRDSKRFDGPQMKFTHSEWAGFVARVKAGEAGKPGNRSSPCRM
jgi:Domain of unknown function (DUF397)